MTHEAARLRLKTRVFAPVVVLSGVLGNYFMKRGMPATLNFPLDYITVLLRWVCCSWCSGCSRAWRC
jgi:hypothetical protein